MYVMKELKSPICLNCFSGMLLYDGPTIQIYQWTTNSGMVTRLPLCLCSLHPCTIKGKNLTNYENESGGKVTCGQTWWLHFCLQGPSTEGEDKYLQVVLSSRGAVWQEQTHKINLNTQVKISVRNIFTLKFHPCNLSLYTSHNLIAMIWIWNVLWRPIH